MSGRKGARKFVAALVLGLVTAASAAMFAGVAEAPSHATVVAGDSWCC